MLSNLNRSFINIVKMQKISIFTIIHFSYIVNQNWILYVKNKIHNILFYKNITNSKIIYMGNTQHNWHVNEDYDMCEM